MLDLKSACELWRATPKDKRIKVLATKDISRCREQFILDVLSDEAFTNRGNNTVLADEIAKCPEIAGDLHIPHWAKRARDNAALVIQMQEDELVDFGFWECLEIPGLELSISNLGDNLAKPGFHAVHGGMGAGKTSNVLIPLAKQLPSHERGLIVVPNVLTAYKIADALKDYGWVSYHAQGKSPDDVKHCLEHFSRVVTCCASLKHLPEDVVPYTTIFCDEITELMGYSAKEKTGKPTDAGWYESLKKLYELLNWSKRAYFFSADMAKGYALSVLEDFARESKRQAFYYKTIENYAAKNIYKQWDDIDHLLIEIGRHLRSGQSGYMYTNLSTKNGELSTLKDKIKRLSPNSEVEVIDRHMLNNSPKGSQIREEGLEEYIIRKKMETDNYFLIVSPVLQSQYNLVFEEEADAFDRCFFWIKHSEITTVDGAIQGCGRARQTRQIDGVIEEHYMGVKSVYKSSWTYEHPRKPDFKDALPWEIAYTYTKYRNTQYQLTNLASRKWLFELAVTSKGAKHFYVSDFKATPQEIADLELAGAYAKEQAEIRLARFPENDLTKKLKLLNTIMRYDGGEWKGLPKDCDVEKIANDYVITREAAERIFSVWIMEPEEREQIEREYEFLQYATCGEIFEKTLTDLIRTTSIQKQLDFFEWFLEGDESVYFELSHPIDEVERDVKENSELVRTTLGLERGRYGTVAGFLRSIGDCIGLEITPPVTARDANKKEWRKQLFQHYEIPGLVKKTMKVQEKYDAIEDSLRKELGRGRNDFEWFEERFIDTFEGVYKARKKKYIPNEVYMAYKIFLDKWRESGKISPHEEILEIQKEQEIEDSILASQIKS